MAKCGTKKLTLFSIAFALLANFFSNADEDVWRIYFEEANGDVYFYDMSRVKKTFDLHTVWSRIRYKRTVMAAASYQSLVEVDCAQRTERTLQRTFFSDKHWEDPAMKTDTKPKRKRPIKEGSAAERLSAILCDP